MACFPATIAAVDHLPATLPHHQASNTTTPASNARQSQEAKVIIENWRRRYNTNLTMRKLHVVERVCIAELAAKRICVRSLRNTDGRPRNADHAQRTGDSRDAEECDESSTGLSMRTEAQVTRAAL